MEGTAGMTAVRLASALLWLSSIGLGLPGLLAIRNLLSGRPIPLVFGYSAYGCGVFERFGIATTVPLLLAFLVVCVLDGVAAWLVGNGDEKSGALLSIALLPFEAVFWIGFSLPYPPVAALIRRCSSC